MWKNTKERLDERKGVSKIYMTTPGKGGISNNKISLNFTRAQFARETRMNEKDEREATKIEQCIIADTSRRSWSPKLGKLSSQTDRPSIFLRQTMNTVSMNLQRTYICKPVLNAIRTDFFVFVKFEQTRFRSNLGSFYRIRKKNWHTPRSLSFSFFK